MAEIINLNRFRKARDKAEKGVRAAENRILFGQAKKTKTLAEKRAAIEVERHEGHRLEGRDEE